jgi:hypothetical protein
VREVALSSIFTAIGAIESASGTLTQLLNYSQVSRHPRAAAATTTTTTTTATTTTTDR